MRVREKYVNFIDKFILDFCKAFTNDDQSANKRMFAGEDKSLNDQVNGLQSKFADIVRVFSNISNLNAQKRIIYID
jgi:hypothetical protein